MKVQSLEVKANLHRRLRRVEGQVRGVQRMLDDDRDCREIVQQLKASQAALERATVVFMRGYAQECLRLAASDDEAGRAAILDELFGLMTGAG